MADNNIHFERYAVKNYISDFLNTCKFFARHNKTVITPVIIYVTALVVCHDVSCLKAAKEILGVSHDTLQNVLCFIRYDASPMVLTLVSTLMPNIGDRGWLIIDDVIIHKPHSKHTAYAFTIMDHSTNKYIQGINVVVLLWSNGMISIPLGFRIYANKEYAKNQGIPFKTKIQLAMELLDMGIIKLLPVQYVTFDSWYPAKELLKHIASKNMHYVCMIRKNRKLKLTEKAGYSRADLICKSFDVTQFRYYKQFGFYAKGVEAILKDVGPTKLLMVKNGYRASIHQTRFIITDIPNLSATQILDSYLNRWTIEVFFRNIKQLLSFENFLYRTTYPIIGHISLVFTAYIILETVRLKNNYATIGDTKRFLSNISAVTMDNQLYYVYNSQNIQQIIQANQKEDSIATIIFGEKCS